MIKHTLLPIALHPINPLPHTPNTFPKFILRRPQFCMRRREMLEFGGESLLDLLQLGCWEGAYVHYFDLACVW